MKKTQNSNGGLTYDREDGSQVFTFSAAKVAEHGEASLDAHFKVPAYKPSPYSLHREDMRLYDQKAHEEE